MIEEFIAWHCSEVGRLAQQVSIEAAARFNENMKNNWASWSAAMKFMENSQ